MPVPLETTRLRLRLWSEEDALVMWQLNEDPGVLEFTGDENFESVEATREFLRGYGQFERYKMGRFVVELKGTAEVLGWCGLKYDEAKGLCGSWVPVFQKILESGIRH